MATRQEQEHLKHIAERRADTVSFLSGDRKPEQERSACAAFLRGLGVPFLVAEVRSTIRGQDPPDVIFRDGCFEVCEVLNQDRKRHDEARALARQAQQAQTIEDIWLPSAALTIWLCNRIGQFTLIVGTDPLHEFRHREHASGFHHRPFPMNPFGFNGIEPGTLAR
jgi:hypothetical protein